MKAEKIRLKNFRNIESQEISFFDGINIFCGKNAQGKTNILESLYYFASLRSFRNGKDRDMIRFGEDFFENTLYFDKENRINEFKIFYGPPKKQLFYNGVKIRKSGDLIGRFLSVLFAPEHLNLVKSGPSERRKFIDLALCQLRPAYFSALLEYQKVIDQKTALMKRYESGGFNENIFDIYNEKMAKLGAYIIKERFAYIRRLNEAAKLYHDDISSEKEKLFLNYLPSLKIEEGFSLDEGVSIVYKELCMMKKKEIITGLCLVGPHRDNLEVEINEKNARLFCSQGQQRSSVLSLKLGECEIFKDDFLEYPVLLLDDIMSELDKGRQNYILNQIKGKQVILTCCEEELFTSVGNKAVFFVKDGIITQA